MAFLYSFCYYSWVKFRFTAHAKYRLFIERNISADAVRLAIQKPDSVTYLPNGAVKCLKCLDEGELVVVYAKEKSVYVIVTAYFK